MGQRGRLLLPTGTPALTLMNQNLQNALQTLPQMTTDAAKQQIVEWGGKVQAPEKYTHCPNETVWLIALMGTTETGMTLQEAINRWVETTTHKTKRKPLPGHCPNCGHPLA